MITGMDVYPFDRLVRAIDELQRSGEVGEEFFVQLGSSRYQPVHARFERHLSFDAVRDTIRAASVVVTHAGAGSTLVCIQMGKHPILVPRRPAWGEIVDEHQVRFAEKLGQEGLATPVHELGGLATAIAEVRGRPAGGTAAGRAGALTAWLKDYWAGLPAR